MPRPSILNEYDAVGAVYLRIGIVPASTDRERHRVEPGHANKTNFAVLAGPTAVGGSGVPGPGPAVPEKPRSKLDVIPEP